MANTINTYNELADAIQDTTKAREDSGRFISLAEKEIVRRLRVYEMEASTTLTAVSSVVTVPTDYVAIKRLSDVGEPDKSYEQIGALELFRRYEDTTGIRGGYFAREANVLEIRPKPGASSQYDFVYWTRPTTLSPSAQTNDIFPEYADLYYLLGCSFSFAAQKEFDSADRFEAKFEDKIAAANKEARGETGSSAVRVLPPLTA